MNDFEYIRSYTGDGTTMIYHNSQRGIILDVLQRGGAFTERELGKITTGKECLGSRAIISQLRNDGYKIAHKRGYNETTKRYNVKYYMVHNDGEYMKYCLKNGYFNFTPGPKC